MRVFAVIPAYNEEVTVGEVVRQCLQQTAYSKQITAVSSGLSAVSQIIVVDDGSTDHTAEVARAAGAIVLRHPINRGLGAALSTGIEAALRFRADSRQPTADSELFAVSCKPSASIIVTLDADGQHDPEEIPRLVEPIIKGRAEVVIGSRLKCRMQNAECRMPWHRIVANWCGNLFTWLLFGIWVTDSQSGFRAFSAPAAAKLQLRTSTMEVSSEIIREIARLHLLMAEVPIRVRYSHYSLSKGQGFIKGLETLWKLIVLRFFR